MKKIILKIINHYDYSIKFINIKKQVRSRLNGINLNVGCGNNRIKGFINLDYIMHPYYNGDKSNCINYNMRSDPLPFKNNSVDNIYCSHVIEHIETIYVKKFIEESKRVLKTNGVLRIVCPDTQYLWSKLINHPDFFSWHRFYDGTTSSAAKCFIQQVATPRLKLKNYGLEKNLSNYNYDYLVNELKEGLTYDIKSQGEHINNWDHMRLSKIGMKLKFSNIVNSKFQSSLREALRGEDMDLTQPIVALHTEFVK